MGNRINITFHGVGVPPHPVDDGEARVWVSADQFRMHLDHARDMEDLTITFDDGNRSDLEIALPELTKRNLKATFFVVADRIGKPGYLSAEDIVALRDADMGIGSHGMYHRPWRRLTSDDFDVEIGEAKKKIEGVLGRSVSEAACPFGSYGRRSLSRLKEEGFSVVYTSDMGAAQESEWLQARTTIASDHTDSLWDTLAEQYRDGVPAKAKLKRLIKTLR